MDARLPGQSDGVFYHSVEIPELFLVFKFSIYDKSNESASQACKISNRRKWLVFSMSGTVSRFDLCEYRKVESQ